MAINYKPVGWDTTKYINPTNMNHMDEGIKAACDKADANEKAIEDVNNNFEWKSLYTNISDSNAHSLPDRWSELLVIMQNSDGYNASNNVINLFMSGAVKSFILSGCGTFNISSSTITKTSGNYMTVYYR